MSDSSIRTKPSIEEPSNMMSPSSAFSNCVSGISTFLLMPRISVNCRRRKRTLFFVASSRMSFLPAPEVSGTVARDFGVKSASACREGTRDWEAGNLWQQDYHVKQKVHYLHGIAAISPRDETKGA